MNFFSRFKKSIKDFFCPPPKPEFRMTQPAKPLVWNDEGVLLDTHGTNGDHFFEHFSGHIVCFQTECEVQDATFQYHAGGMRFLAGERPAPCMDPGAALKQNWLDWKNGTLLSGHLDCRSWKNGTVTGGELVCGDFESGTVNGGVVSCTVWKGGTVNDGKIGCVKWLCGTFHSGVFKGEWRNGIWNGGTFCGEWYGGIWNNGTWQGKVLTGDGTFEWILNNKKGSRI